MLTLVFIAAGVLAMLFIFFLTISKAASGIDNALYKLEYLVRKECDIRLENLEIKYKIKAADKKYEEIYQANIKHIDNEIHKAVDSNE